MLTGAYSSIFVASPLLGWLKARSPAFAGRGTGAGDHLAGEDLRAVVIAGPGGVRPISDAAGAGATAGAEPARRRRRRRRRPPRRPSRRPPRRPPAHPPAAPAQEEAPLTASDGRPVVGSHGARPPTSVSSVHDGTHDPVTPASTADAGCARSCARSPTIPEPGVTFRDITPLLGNAGGLPPVPSTSSPTASPTSRSTASSASRPAASSSPRRSPTASAPAFVPVRKAGKLPWAVVREEYQLEYGRDKLEIHRDAIHPDERILVIDDVLATGGTAAATARLVEALGGVDRRHRLPHRDRRRSAAGPRSATAALEVLASY